MRTHKWLIAVVVLSCQYASVGYAASPWQNSTLPGDVNGDGNITPLDVLVVTNVLNSVGPHALTSADAAPPYVDVNGDGNLSALDVLIVTNCLNSSACPKSGGGGGSSSGGSQNSSGDAIPKQAEGEAQGAPPPVLITPTPTPPPGRADCSLTDIDRYLNPTANNCRARDLCPADPSNPLLAFSSNWNLIQVCSDRNCCPTPTPTPQPQFCCWNPQGAYCTSSLLYGPFRPGYGCSPEPVNSCSDCRAPETPTPTPTPQPQFCCWNPQGAYCTSSLLYGPFRPGYGCSPEPVNSCNDCRAPETPTPTPSPQTCAYYSVDMRHYWSSIDMVPADLLPNQDILHGSASTLPCLLEILALCKSNNKVDLNTQTNPVTANLDWDDDCVAGTFLCRARPSIWNSFYQQDLYCDPQTNLYKPGAFDLSILTNPGGPNDKTEIVAGSVRVTTRRFIMNDQCRTQNVTEPQNLCGNLEVQSITSPISLLWAGQSKIKEQEAIVRFPLQAGVAGKLYNWKASAEAPLLVYDPARRGTADSGRELFGNWTFGGKRLAAMNGRSGAIGQQAWRDGYEALSTLDRNGDGRIEGAEREALALWFDRNRDGVSQPGEVVPLEEAGVTALYYQPDYTDPESGDIYVRRGFERVVNGRTVTGVSVDWQAKVYESEGHALLQKLVHDSSSRIVATDEGGLPAALPPDAPAAAQDAGFSGAWAWSMELDPGQKRAAGILTMREKNGQVTGRSYVEVPLKENGKKLKSYIAIFTIKGRSGLNSAGVPQVDFDVLDGEHVVLHSQATLPGDGKLLVGKSRGARDGQKLAYSWVAAGGRDRRLAR